MRNLCCSDMDQIGLLAREHVWDACFEQATPVQKQVIQPTSCLTPTMLLRGTESSCQMQAGYWRPTNCVFIHKLDGLLRSEDKAVIGQVHKSLLYIKVPGERLPTDLHPQAPTLMRLCVQAQHHIQQTNTVSKKIVSLVRVRAELQVSTVHPCLDKA